MTSRGKKLVALAKKRYESNTDGTSNKVCPTLTDTLNEPVPCCSKYQQGEDSDDIEEELQSLFGDISDTDDPTYCPPNDSYQLEKEDSDNISDQIQLEDLLGETMIYEQHDVDVLNNIENFDQYNKQHREATDIVENILSMVFKKVWLLVKPLKRWKESDPNNWACNVAKKRRADGLPYKIKRRVRPAKVPKDIDCAMGKCQFNCSDIFCADDRNTICRLFWNLDFQGRKNFILNNITIHTPKRVLAVRNQRPQKKYTKKCFFSKDNELKQVCQNFFCKTLCISPGVITDAIKKRSDRNYFEVNDRRGVHEPMNKTKPNIIQEIKKHIESFPCMESHYTRKDTKRKYLEKNLNIRKMHLLYKEECLKNGTEPASEICYRRIFGKDYNLSFFVPRKDQCLICSNYNNAETEKKIQLEEAYLAHQERKNICASEKEKDKIRSNTDEQFSSVTFDLQAVLQIPACDVSLLYYSRKLCVHNLAIYEAKFPNNAYCFAWSEINGKKGSSEIGSILLHYLSNCVPSNITEISLFSDTCGGQNRNQFVAALLLWAVQKIEHLQVIEQKFFESGHSHMEADSIHSSIESAKKYVSVFSMIDWISIFRNARRKKSQNVDGKKIIREPYKVKEFKYDEFYDLKSLANMTKVIKSNG